MTFTIKLLWGVDVVYVEQVHRTPTMRLGVEQRLSRAVTDIERRVRFPYDEIQVLNGDGTVFRRITRRAA